MRLSVGAGVLMLFLAPTEAVAAWNTGQIGMHADHAATTACADVPAGSYTMLHVIATRGENTWGDVSGVEFRIEVTQPEGWTIYYVPPAGAILIGNPIDVQPADPDDDSGANVAFPTCQPWDANGRIDLGKLFVQNAGGGPTELLVKRRSKPLNRGWPCALFVDCSSRFALTCNSPVLASSCAGPGLPRERNTGRDCDDAPYSVFALNREPDPRWTTPPRQRDVDREVLAMLTRRTLVELPEGEPEGRIEDAIVRSEPLRAALERHAVEWVAKGMPCFDLADTVAVTRTGETVRLTDWSTLWIFTVPTHAGVQALIDDLSALWNEVVYAERNGRVVTWNSLESSVRIPNPIVQSGNMKIVVPRPTPVRIEIYDAAGRRTKALLNRPLPAGPSDVLWDGTDDGSRLVPSGVYFVHVMVGERGATHKLVFVR
jgi:hypothetical protein